MTGSFKGWTRFFIYAFLIIFLSSFVYANSEDLGVALTAGTVTGYSAPTYRGVKITVDDVICIKNVTFSSGTTGNQCVIGNYTGGGAHTTLETGTSFSGSTCIFDNGLNLSTTGTYAIFNNNTAGTFNSDYTAESVLQDTGYIDWEAGFRGGTTDDTRFYAIETIGFDVGLCSPPPPTNLTFTANNVYDNSAINNFNITINGTTYTTTTGTITTAITDNNADNWNYNFSASGYYDQTGSINASANITEQVNSYQAILNLQGVELITEDILTGVTFNSSSQSDTNTLYVNSGTINVGAVKSGYYNISKTYTITGLTNTTQNFTGMYNSKLTVYAWDYINSTYVQNFTLTVEGLNETYTNSTNASGTSITFNLIQDYYNISIDHPRYVPITVTQKTAFATTLNQTVTPYNSINFTFKDELTDALVTNLIEIAILGPDATYNFTTTTGSLFVGDLLAPQEYVISYKSSGYTNRSYYFDLSNRTTTDLTLYLLNSSSDTFTSTTITVIDEYGDELPDAVVKVLRYVQEQNNYVLEEAPTTNFEGDVVVDLVLNSYYYYFIVEYPAGTPVKTTSPSYIYTNSLTIPVTLGDSIAEDYFTLEDITYNLYFNEVTNSFVYSYNDGANLASQGCLKVYRMRVTGDTFVNSTCVSGAANTMSIAVNNVTGARYIARGYVTLDEEYLIDTEEHYFDTTDVFSGMGLILTILMMVALAVIGFISGATVALTITPLGLIISNAIGLISLSWGIVISIQAIGIILAFVISKNR